MKRFWKLFRRPDDESETMFTPSGARATFQLCYGEKEVGKLSLDAGRWRFRYSDYFKDSSLRPITEFPDLDREYESDDLWAFFETRIPSRKQTRVKEIIQRKQIDEHDELQMLRQFGRKTVANPFELVEVR